MSEIRRTGSEDQVLGYDPQEGHGVPAVEAHTEVPCARCQSAIVARKGLWCAECRQQVSEQIQREAEARQELASREPLASIESGDVFNEVRR